jgi:DNA-binding response OmpR family regulator
MKKALIVEDDAAHQHLLQHLARKEGSGADIAADGLEAIALAKENNYDVIILDIKMPHLDGREVLEYLKQNAPGMLQRTIVVSALHEEYLHVIKNEYGIPIIAKPFELDAVREGIRRIFGT